mmetsp:Transcript_86/g.220  ORF Transcript_86/g.220 Transcript_86/m.220 type:complete len:256 (+) Transcript_86:1757-2524(+)
MVATRLRQSCYCDVAITHSFHLEDSALLGHSIQGGKDAFQQGEDLTGFTYRGPGREASYVGEHDCGFQKQIGNGFGTRKFIKGQTSVVNIVIIQKAFQLSLVIVEKGTLAATTLALGFFLGFRFQQAIANVAWEKRSQELVGPGGVHHHLGGTPALKGVICQKCHNHGDKDRPHQHGYTDGSRSLVFIFEGGSGIQVDSEEANPQAGSTDLVFVKVKGGRNLVLVIGGIVQITPSQKDSILAAQFPCHGATTGII